MENDDSDYQPTKRAATRHRKSVKCRGRSKSRTPAKHPPLHVAEGKRNSPNDILYLAQNFHTQTVMDFFCVLGILGILGFLWLKKPGQCPKNEDTGSVSIDLDRYVSEITAQVSFYEELGSMDAFLATHDNVAYSLLEQRFAIKKLDLDAPTQIAILGKIDAYLAAADDVAAALKALEADIALVSTVPHECLKSANSLERLQSDWNEFPDGVRGIFHYPFVRITLSGLDILNQTLLRPLDRLECCLKSLKRAEESIQDLTKTMQEVQDEVDLTRDQVGFWARTRLSNSGQLLHDLERNLYTVIPAWHGVQGFLLEIQEELQAYQQATSGLRPLLELDLNSICNLTSLDMVPRSFRAIPSNSSYPSLGNYVDGSWDRKAKQHLKPNNEETVWPRTQRTLSAASGHF